MPIHRIRLQGPWETPLSDGTSARIPLPAPLSRLLNGMNQPVILRRSFHRPTNLDSGETVFLVLENLPAPGSVALNDARLGDWSMANLAQRFPITPLLMPRNQIRLELTSLPTSLVATDDSFPWINVSLEIVSDPVVTPHDAGVRPEP